jgi:hypothetical protein
VNLGNLGNIQYIVIADSSLVTRGLSLGVGKMGNLGKLGKEKTCEIVLKSEKKCEIRRRQRAMANKNCKKMSKEI